MNLVIRVPKNVRLGSRAYNVIDEHNQILAARGRVALGKFGAPLSGRVIDSIREVLRNGAPRLYLVNKERDDFIGASADIAGIGEFSGRDDAVSPFFPDYYEDLVDSPGSYVMLKSKLQYADLTLLKLSSNGRPLVDVIRECRTTTILVK